MRSPCELKAGYEQAEARINETCDTLKQKQRANFPGNQGEDFLAEFFFVPLCCQPNETTELNMYLLQSEAHVKSANLAASSQKKRSKDNQPAAPCSTCRHIVLTRRCSRKQ